MRVCVHPETYTGYKSECTGANVSIATGFIALCIYTHICLCFLGDRVDFLERMLFPVIINKNEL